MSTTSHRFNAWIWRTKTIKIEKQCVTADEGKAWIRRHLSGKALEIDEWGLLENDSLVAASASVRERVEKEGIGCVW